VITARAPGKLMLAGEYAVALAQAPALAVAVGRHATVTAWEDPNVCGWRLSAPDLGLKDAPLTHVPVVSAAVQAVSPSGNGHLRVESELGVGPHKPGLGGSAAITVAAMAALCALEGREAPSLQDLVSAHRLAQGGRGSGYDVATVYHGGVCAYGWAAKRPIARALDWPEGLRAAVIFTGQGSQTTRLLGRFACADGREPHLSAMAEATEVLIAAWEAGDVTAILEAARAAEDAAVAADKALEIGITSAPHAALRDAVESAGAVMRTSGSGGGDCVWALAADDETLDRAVAQARRVGGERLDLTFPATGCEVEEEEAR